MHKLPDTARNNANKKIGIHIRKRVKCGKNIMNKMGKRGLYRHIDGNTMDNRIANLAKVTPQQALRHKDWTVDACLVLTDDEYLLWEKARGNDSERFENQYVMMSPD